MIKVVLTSLAFGLAASSASLGNSEFTVALDHKKLNRFEIKELAPREFQFIETRSGFVYTLKIWDDLSRIGVRLYYEQGLESMPRVFKGNGFKLHHKEQNSKYMGFTFSLSDEIHLEYVLDIGPRLGILIESTGPSAQHLARLHDVLFLINNATVARRATTTD